MTSLRFAERLNGHNNELRPWLLQGSESIAASIPTPHHNHTGGGGGGIQIANFKPVCGSHAPCPLCEFVPVPLTLGTSLMLYQPYKYYHMSVLKPLGPRRRLCILAVTDLDPLLPGGRGPTSSPTQLTRRPSASRDHESYALRAIELFIEPKARASRYPAWQTSHFPKPDPEG